MKVKLSNNLLVAVLQAMLAVCRGIKMKEYSKGIYVKFKPEEVEMIHDRMKEAGVQNMSAFIRKMVLNGYMIIPEWPELKGVLSLHSRISNNLNQYAKKANETGNIYREDIAELKEMQLQFLPVSCLEDILSSRNSRVQKEQNMEQKSWILCHHI